MKNFSFANLEVGCITYIVQGPTLTTVHENPHRRRSHASRTVDCESNGAILLTFLNLFTARVLLTEGVD